MPIFDYKCGCGHLEENMFVHSFDDVVFCSECEAEMKQLFSCEFTDVLQFPKEGIFMKHVSAFGQTFHSRKEMRQFEKSNDMIIERIH